jgi:hypothetical protein
VNQLFGPNALVFRSFCSTIRYDTEINEYTSSFYAENDTLRNRPISLGISLSLSLSLFFFCCCNRFGAVLALSNKQLVVLLMIKDLQLPSAFCLTIHMMANPYRCHVLKMILESTWQSGFISRVEGNGAKNRIGRYLILRMGHLHQLSPDGHQLVSSQASPNHKFGQNVACQIQSKCPHEKCPRKANPTRPSENSRVLEQFFVRIYLALFDRNREAFFKPNLTLPLCCRKEMPQFVSLLSLSFSHSLTLSLFLSLFFSFTLSLYLSLFLSLWDGIHQSF